MTRTQGNIALFLLAIVVGWLFVVMLAVVNIAATVEERLPVPTTLAQ